ncbi:hypothetical protein GCM10011312_25540 [Planktosalinus lacus]|uniref:Uncharacterized protein n=1 Tax=Planktosalinus lacus TaxID=1526573 RepID=A0A8J2YBT2_9FLAO|nr:hypothetical protein GCM10011312_25540 [Planktosalinus lacus]
MQGILAKWLGFDFKNIKYFAEINENELKPIQFVIFSKIGTAISMINSNFVS